MDVRSAFASVRRSSRITVENGNEECVLYLGMCGFELDMAQRIVDNACRIGMLIENGLNEQAAEVLAELHANA